MESSDRYHVRSVKRAISVIKCFNFKEPELPLTELAKRSGLDISTVWRLLITLESEGVVELNKHTGKYQLGVTCLNLGSIFLSHIELSTRVFPVLANLRETTLETVHLAVMDNMEAVYLEKLESPLPIAMMGSRVGKRLPAYCTGLGKVLLSHEDPAKVQAYFCDNGLFRYTTNTITTTEVLMRELEFIRVHGFALDNMEHENGVSCIAAPIRDHRGKVVAALSVAGPENRITALINERAGVEVVVAAAKEASRLLGYLIR